MLSPETIAALAQPLDTSRLSYLKVPGKPDMAYLDGEDNIRTANRIFGYGNWGFRLLSAPWSVQSGKAVWFAHGELTVAGCPVHQDVGACEQSGEGAAALEMAVKGAVTDAIKRCLDHWGDQFGLGLRDKDVQRALRQGGGQHPQSQQSTPAPAETSHPAVHGGVTNIRNWLKEMDVPANHEAVCMALDVRKADLTKETWEATVTNYLEQPGNNVGTFKARFTKAKAELARQEATPA